MGAFKNFGGGENYLDNISSLGILVTYWMLLHNRGFDVKLSLSVLYVEIPNLAEQLLQLPSNKPNSVAKYFC